MTEQRYAVPIDREYYSLTFDHELLTTLRARSLSPQVIDLYNVGTIRPDHHNKDTSGYVLAVVSHLKAPLDELDVAATERTESLICGCPGWHFHSYDEQIGAKIDDCKHCEDVKAQRNGETTPAEQAAIGD